MDLLRVAYPDPPKTSSKFVLNFLSYPADRQTHKSKKITFLHDQILGRVVLHTKFIFIYFNNTLDGNK